MSNTQPEGAIARTFSGSVTDTRFAEDGALLVASGSTLYRMGAIDGVVLSQYDLPEAIRTFDVSQDGRFIYVAVSGSALPAPLLRIDTQDGSITSYPLEASADIKGAIADLACLDDGTVLLSQTAANASLLRFDPATGTIAAAGGNVSAGTLISSEDGDTVFVISRDISARTYLYSSGSGIIGSRTGIDDPYAGAGIPPAPSPVGALSPDEATIVFGSSMATVDGQLQPLAPFKPLFTPNGLAFSPSGDTIYAARWDVVVAYDTASREAVAVYRLLPDGGEPAAASPSTVANGDIVQVSADGRFLSVITTTGVQVIDLSLAVPDADGGTNVIRQGSWQYGLGGDDVLGGPGYQWMTGGTGDDTYLVDDPSEQIVEAPGGGTDRILLTAPASRVFFSMAANVEAFTFLGSGQLTASGNDSANLMIGGPSADTISGGGGADILHGGDGDDVLSSGLGAASSSSTDVPSAEWDPLSAHDVLWGEAGNDLITITAGDTADGGADFDTLRISFASSAEGVTFDTAPLAGGQPFDLAGGTIQNFEAVDLLFGSSFADQITVSGPTGVARTQVRGGDGDDVIIATTSSITGRGGGGDDRFVSGTAADHFYGDEGFDTVDYRQHASGVTVSLIGASGADGDVLYTIEGVIGSIHDDIITGSHSTNRLNGWMGDDVIDGGGNSDDLNGGSGQDRLFGGSGNDKLNGGTGDDQLSGGDDRDIASGNDGDDLIDGGAGDDVLAGGKGADHLSGGAGNDRLNGGEGDDVLIGGAGVDYMVGGAGADTFVFAPGDSGVGIGTRDQIDRFEYGIDKIDLTAFAGATVAILARATFDIVSIDFDGGSPDMAIRVNHTGAGTLGLDDILL